jgi:zinc transport system substrate-binding protein
MKTLWFTCLLFCMLTVSAHARVDIVTSIEPLALIGKAVVGDYGQIRSLVDPRQSPHEYSIRPSDRIAIEQANLLIWVDPGFELYLTDVFNTQAATKTLLTFSRLQDVELAFEESGELDPHLWLDTHNALRLAEAIAKAASAIDPLNEINFQGNLDKFRIELEAASQDISAIFANKVEKTYAVYHNAYRYFENQFELQYSIVLLKHPESQANFQEIMQVRRSVQELQPRCLLIELDSNGATIATMLGGVELDMPIIDTMGYDVIADATGYITMLRKLAEQFRQCVY